MIISEQKMNNYMLDIGEDYTFQTQLCDSNLYLTLINQLNVMLF